MDSTSSYRGPYSMVNLMVTEKDYLKYAQSINKAIVGLECPVKPKHLRFTVVGTFREQGAKTFWSVALRAPYLDDRIVAWKLCYVVHKILREGHPLCLVHSQAHKKELDEMGKLWRHLRGTYSQAIRLYANLLITKIDFHSKNPRFPGNLVVNDDELNSILSNDINNYFEVAVEIFDYLDRIIELQSAIFGPINITQNNSDFLSAADQCLLSPIVLCLQDASKLYDYSVKIMFKLHLTVPGEVISGHRDRFLKAFQELKEFYKRTNRIPYLRNLVTVQHLPNDPPDFFKESEFYSYVTQDVTLPEEGTLSDTSHFSKSTESLDFSYSHHGSNEGTLIDISSLDDEFRGNPFRTDHTLSPSAPIYEQLNFKNETEKDTHTHVENDVELMRGKLDSVVLENQRKTLSLESRILELEAELEEKNRQLTIERQMRESLQKAAVPEVVSNQTGRFGFGEANKITDLYAKLRFDYIEVLRKNGELQKQVFDLKTKLAEKETESFV
ncbi:huntingtin-interacting protein 1 [Agrilus planipennis]|uniref:Huntingtin-interacting protein 1 n=1 Tax=Agrilus planipennis TaxID=224129 RepID=A0A1W4WDJ0_AGRPL|nr:huntingtin-interacting protein 1 [Agrilus planipennis]XP_018322032.1 huntingtin-interacting protein 1 [Agrilus planipennis]